MSWKPSQNFSGPQTAYQQPPPQKLHNGALGPNFNISKSSNLSNSAVLRMLQEQEDDQRICGSIKKEVVWPPPQEDPEGEDVPDSQPHYNSQSTNSYDDPAYRRSQKKFEPPPTVIRLRESPPLTHNSAPVYKSQPAADTIKGGFRMLGDQKWPPPECKAQIEAENQARVELARGPAFRPPKPRKDYSSFFAKNALPNTYPGYKAPPGTQHFTEPPVTQY